MFKKTLLTILILTGSSFGAYAQEQADNNLLSMKEVRVYGGYSNNDRYINKLVGLELVPQKQPFESVDILFNGEYHDSSFKGKLAKSYKGKNYDFQRETSWVNFGIKARKTFDNGIYLKGGVGIAYIEDRAYARNLTGGHWQFSPSYSIGYNITKNASIEYQYVHFSNGRTAPPNPGRDFHYITLGYKF